MRKPLTLLGMAALLLLVATLALPAAAAPNVCRDLPTGAQAGDVITVSLAVTDVNGVNWHLVDETIPPGLTVVDAGGANTDTSGHLKWSATAPSPDVTYTYTVTGSAGIYTFDGVYLVSGGDETPIDCDTGLEIGGGSTTDPNVCRDLPTGAQAEGAEITVSLAVTDVNGVNWHLVDETIPPGLTVVDAGGANTDTSGHLKWSATAPSPDVTYTYTVTGSAGSYTFDGAYLVAGGDETPIDCDTELVIGGDPTDPNVCRDLPTGAQAEGAEITVSLAVTDVNGVNWHLVDETIPPGMTVVDAGGANTDTSGHLKWSATAPSPDVTYTYTVTGSAGSYTFDGVYLVAGGDETPIDCDTGLEIGGGSTTDPNVCRDLPTGAQAEGAEITVSLAVTDVNGVNWHLVDETIPPGLTVVDAGGANTDTSGHLKWSATAPSPDVTYTYTVTGSAGSYTFDGVYLVAGGDETPIDCDTGLEIIQNNPPAVTVNYPVDGTVSGTIVVTADANDDPDGTVTQVEFFLIPDGSSIGTDTNGTDGWSVPLDTTTVIDGDYQIKAVATDDEGATGDDTGGVFAIDNSCPCDFCLDLDAGWNLVSVPRMLDGPTEAKTVFNLSSTELCECYNGCTGSWSCASPCDMQVTPGRGYMVAKASAETRCLNFDDSGTAIPLSQQLCADDWNMIGFSSLSSMSVADFGTVTALDGKFTMVWQWNSGWEMVSPPDSNSMVPGKGYLLWMTDDGVLPGMIA